MSTLSFDGFVYISDALERRQLVRIAPSVEVTRLIHRVRTEISAGETHTIGFGDLPSDEASVLLFSVLDGQANLLVTDDGAVTVTHESTKMMLLLGSKITGIQVVGVADSVYDLIVGGNE